MAMRAIPRFWVGVVLGSILAGDARGQACLERDEMPRVSPHPDEERFLEDFGAALRRFKGMSLDEFRSEYGPRKSYAETAAPFLRGDSNADGVVDLGDPICTLLGLFTGEGPCTQPAIADALDADDTGAIDITDAIYTLLHLFGGGEPPPEPFPEAGEDPTPDALPTGAAFDVADILGYDPMEAEYLGPIRAYLSGGTGGQGLTAWQEDGYRQNGFVILEDQKHDSFALALSDIYFSDLPVYIAADALLDALHLSFDELLKTVEEKLLVEKLDSMLSRLEGGIPALEQRSGGIDARTDLDNVAFWVCAARSLLRGEKQACARPVDAIVNEFLGYVASEGLVHIEVFGVPANPDEPEDFSQFKPRGHYTQSPQLERYFRAMMWVERIGMRFAECPSHAAVAYLIARGLVDTGAIDDWKAIDDVVSLFVGLSDSLDPRGLLAVADQAGLGSVADLYDSERFLGFVRAALESGAGEQRIRSQVLASNPSYIDGFTPLPPMFHVMGQRFIVDSFVFSNVVHDRAPRRPFPSTLDALFVLGNRAVVPLLGAELETWSYHPHLAALDHIVAGYPPDFWRANLYNVWLTALRSLDADTTGPRYPPAMRTRAWERKTLNTQLGSWAQLRHDTILYAKHSYTSDGCDYPDGWVDPYPDLYEALASFADLAQERFADLGLLELDRGIASYLGNLKAHSLMLAGIARSELEGAQLSGEQKVFLESVIKKRQPLCFFLPDGWYSELVFHFRQASLDFAPTIADVHTCVGDICPAFTLEVGTGKPNLMLISVHNECGTRSYIGPVFSYYEFRSDRRWNDNEWRHRLLESSDPPARPEWIHEILR
jgi:hypothetical protein